MHCQPSPQANPNLLTRSEIVAIINTLHRFTESLYAVEGFRALWSATDDPQALLTKVESQKVRPLFSNAVARGLPPSTADTFVSSIVSVTTGGFRQGRQYLVRQASQPRTAM